MVKFCPECGNPIVESNMPFCPKCGSKLPIISPETPPTLSQQPAVLQPVPSSYPSMVSTKPTTSSESRTNERSFNYSIIFYLVTILDLIITFIFGLAIFFMLSSGTFRGSHPIISLIFGIIWVVGFIIDVYLLSKARRSPHSIDINLCWIKSLFGFLGIFTLISGLYFLIISISMKRAYDAERR